MHGRKLRMGKHRRGDGNCPESHLGGEQGQILLGEDPMIVDSLDIPPSPPNPGPPIRYELGEYPPRPRTPTSDQFPTFSNITLLQDFLTHRTGTHYQQSNHQAQDMPNHVERVQRNDSSFDVPMETPQLEMEEEWPTLPAAHLSKVIVLPEQWQIPHSRHRYLASLSFVQRRALVQLLQNDCSVDLSEVDADFGADLILDAHTAVRFLPVPELVPSEIERWTSSLLRLGYGFTRILVVLEAYPFARSTVSAQKLESTRWEALRMITDTVVSGFLKLKRRVGIGMGMLEGAKDQGEGVGDLLGDVQVEFTLSFSVGQTARFIRAMGDYAEGAVDEEERRALWGPRAWLDVPVSLPTIPLALQQCSSLRWMNSRVR